MSGYVDRTEVVVDPDPVTVLVDFLNTLDVETSADDLTTYAAYSAWARQRRLEPGGRGELPRARAVRDALRAAVDGDGELDPGVAVPVRIAADGRPVAAPATATQAVVAAALELAVTGRWARIKLCPADDCREAFYDTSRNRSRVWCDMADCGNRAKLRTFRAR